MQALQEFLQNNEESDHHSDASPSIRESIDTRQTSTG